MDSNKLMDMEAFLYVCFVILAKIFLSLLFFISPRQAGDGIIALVLGEPQLCADPQGPCGTARKPHKPDRLPVPS